MSKQKRRPLDQRFWPKVEKRGPDECWPWLAYKCNNGYGRIHGRGAANQSILAPRVSYELANGPIPPGLFVLHRCDNPSCVNPAHLFLGTQKDNMADCSAKGRARGGVRGEENGNAKLTVDDVKAIRSATLPRRLICRQFGISKTQYWHIKTRSQWRSVP